jgi:spore maturation protein CgeB
VSYWFETNLAVLSQSQPAEAEALAKLKPKVTATGLSYAFNGGEVILAGTDQEVPTLALDLGDGPKRLTSARDPYREDALLAEEFLKAKGGLNGVTAIGFGLGYGLAILLAKLPAEAPVWLWEGRPELAAAALTARDLRPVLSDKRFRLVLTNPNPIDLPPGAPKATLARPANLRLDAALYPASLKKARPLKNPKILFLDAGYYLSRELRNAAQELKSPLQTFAFDPKMVGDREIKAFLTQIKEFRPDLVLTVNHLGLDADGTLVDLFARLSLPLASWFVDSPIYILTEKAKGDVFVFAWDRDYVEPLKDLGFAKATYLPLATDPTFFKPDQSPILRPAAFVGDSLTAATLKYLNLAGLSPSRLPQIDALAQDFLKVPDLTPKRLAETFAAQEGLDPEKTTALWALITWRGSRLSRAAVLKAVAGPGFVVRGDPGWRELAPCLNLQGPLNYYQDLAAFYRTTAVNLNVTSAQMKTGLNQRVFDVPAAGGFLLTDEREQLKDLFAEDEYASYPDPAEAKRLLNQWLKRPRDRAILVNKARARILGEHLYVHRLERIRRHIFGA